MLPRIVLALAASVLAVLIGEGLCSLFLERSVLELLGLRDSIGAVAPREQQDEERFAAAARNPGPYRVHDDPRVGYVLKSGSESVQVEKIAVHADALGLRRRPAEAPAIEEDAVRVVILGDSVAFGWNLPDHQTLAAQLEEVLNEGRSTDTAPIRCRTVAIPGWNVRNAVSFLLDHLDALDPDLVLFLPVENDLEDTDGVYETGHRRNQPDPANPDPWVNVNQNYRYLQVLAGRVQKATGSKLNAAQVGTPALSSALSEESNRRIDDSVSLLLDLRARLGQRGATLSLAPHSHNLVHRLIRARLAERGESLEVLPLLDSMDKDRDTQGDDPHPNATAVRAFACWIAQSLSSRWSPASPPRDFTPPAAFEGLRAAAWNDDQAREWLLEHRRRGLASLADEVNDETGRGAAQIYGGIRLDGSMGPHLLALIASGSELEVALAPLPGRPDLLPVRVRVEVDGEVVGHVSLEAEGQQEVHRFALPENGRDTHEVRLCADSWVMQSIFGKSWPCSCDFRWLQTDTDTED